MGLFALVEHYVSFNQRASYAATARFGFRDAYPVIQYSCGLERLRTTTVWLGITQLGERNAGMLTICPN
jgi:hypothetical protein